VAAERGARWSAGDGTELRLSDFSAKGWVAALDGGTAGFVEGWFVPPVTGDATFLLPKDTQAWLSWSGTATATQLVPLAAVPSPSVGGEPWPAWPSDNDAASDNLGAISAKLGLVKGQSYWLSLNCSAAAAASQGCALGVRLHAATAPHGLSLSGRTLTGRTEVPLCLSLTDRDACCASFERVALGTGFVNQASSGYPCIPAVSSFYASAHLGRTRSAWPGHASHFPARLRARRSPIVTRALMRSTAARRRPMPTNRASRRARTS
jgi:hypothetical protein